MTNLDSNENPCLMETNSISEVMNNKGKPEPIDIIQDEEGLETTDIVNGDGIQNRIEKMQKLVRNSLVRETVQSRKAKKILQMRYNATMGILAIWSSWMMINLIQGTVEMLSDDADHFLIFALM